MEEAQSEWFRAMHAKHSWNTTQGKYGRRCRLRESVEDDDVGLE